MEIYSITHRETEISDNRYLRIYQGSRDEIPEYVNIISDNEVAYDTCLMEFKRKVEDEESIYYYYIGDRVSLFEKAESSGISKTNFINIVYAVAYALTQADKYKLAQECFIIDSRFIYIGEVDALLAYVPFEMDADPKNEFRRLLGFISGKTLDEYEEFRSISAIAERDFTFKEINDYCINHFS